MRLTNQIREQIIDEAIRQKITPKITAIKDEARQIAQLCAEQRYTGKTKDWMDLAPEGAFYGTSTCIIEFADGSYFYHPLLKKDRSGAIEYCNNNRAIIRLLTAVSMLAYDQGKDEVSCSKAHERRLRRMMCALDKLAEHKKEMIDTLKTALWSVGTHKQLVERYPSLSAYLPNTIPAANLPAITDDKVAKVLAA